MSAVSAARIALVVGLGLTSLPALAAGPEGSWFCARDGQAYGTLGIQAGRYLVIRDGQPARPGHYSQAFPQIAIADGPLWSDLGVEAGIVQSTTPRQITFDARHGGDLTCREVL
jgi:hypothetical protein